MLEQDKANERQKKLFITLLAILVMLGLYWVILELTQTRKAEWDSSLDELMERDFRVAVTSVIAQARLNGRVSQVTIELPGNRRAPHPKMKRRVSVNRQGRPYVAGANGQPDCKAIWQQVMGLPLEHGSYALKVEVSAEKNSSQQQQWHCHYRRPNGAGFDYVPELNN